VWITLLPGAGFLRKRDLCTRKTLDFMCDFRIPLTFSLEDCRTIAAVIRQVAEDTLNNH
jgi:hypothetical protein